MDYSDDQKEKHLIERFYKMANVLAPSCSNSNIEGVQEFVNIDYLGLNDINQKLDIYRKDNITEYRPTVIVIHGGGWIYGSKENNKLYSQYLTKRRNFVVVNINYRLLPQVKFVDQVIDVISAINWTVDNINKYLGNFKDIFLVGDSAGAQLILFILSVSSNPKFLTKVNETLVANILPLDIKKISGVGLLSPVERLFDENDTFFPIARKFENLYTKDDVKHKDLINTIVREGYNKDYPKTFVMSSEDDCTFAQAQSISNAVVSSGINNKIVMLPKNNKYVLSHTFNIREPNLKEAKEVEELMTKFFIEG